MSSPRSKRFIQGCTALVLLATLGLVFLVLVVSLSPVTGTQGADFLRELFGNKPVAELEALVFTIQDKFSQLRYSFQPGTPAPPWEVGNVQANTRLPITGPATRPTDIPPYLSMISPTPLGELVQPAAPVEGSGIGILHNSLLSLDRFEDSHPTPTPSPPLWRPVDIPPLGSTPGEGVWSAYILDSSGQVLSYRTFLQPDPERPYVMAAIVAFDLSHVRLHYVLGTREPVAPDFLPGSGQIPASNRQPGMLLAAFNGAFKTIHGHYGVFMNGNILIPPMDRMGTLAFYKDGSLRIGEWDVDMSFTPDMLAYRQNCPLMVENGEINPLVYNNSVNDWGGTISGNVVTFRSGLGLSQDSKTLYYFAGNSLNMPSLARAMLAAGAYQALQLDINNYYVHFTKFELQNGQFVADPLLPKEMTDNVARFLDIYSRDFFYVTANQP